MAHARAAFGELVRLDHSTISATSTQEHDFHELLRLVRLAYSPGVAEEDKARVQSLLAHVLPTLELKYKEPK